MTLPTTGPEPSRTPDVGAMLSGALLLADGRLPTGGHAHSGGVEAAVARGLVGDLDDLAAWVRGGLATTWWLDACAAVLARRLAARGATADRAAHHDVQALDREVTARTTAPAARRAARALGRQAARTGRVAWPHARLDDVMATDPDGPLAPLVLGVLAEAAGLDDHATAAVSLHGAAQGATGAGVRLLGLDPFGAARVVAAAAPRIDTLARSAADIGDDPRDLPAPGAPLLDLLVGAHEVADTRLFAS